jgi:hypothetical protein
MTGIKTTLDCMGFPLSIVSLILSFHYIEAPTNNDAIFNLFDDFINIFMYTNIFCRLYKIEFSKKIMLAVEDLEFGFSEKSRYHYSPLIDETHYRQLVYMQVVDPDAPDPELEQMYILRIRNWMICESYSIARALAFSPFQTKINYWCNECHEDTTTIPDYTIADKIDNGRVATACIKHR